MKKESGQERAKMNHHCRLELAPFKASSHYSYAVAFSKENLFWTVSASLLIWVIVTQSVLICFVLLQWVWNYAHLNPFGLIFLNINQIVNVYILQILLLAGVFFGAFEIKRASACLAIEKCWDPLSSFILLKSSNFGWKLYYASHMQNDECCT